MPETTAQPTSAQTADGTFIQLRWPDISQPGSYVFNSTGQLCRVPPDAIKEGRSPTIEITGTREVVMTRISPNPFDPITSLRMKAADLDLPVNF